MAKTSENSADELKQLYERFRNDLFGNHTDMYYDEDDLIMIFDLAGDYLDRYVQLQALMIGRRLFPDSEQLELRLGLAMLDMYDDVSIDDFLRVNSHRQGLLWDIIRLRGRRDKPVDISSELDGLLERYTFEEDEDIIQFVNLISAYECENWLVDNYHRFVDRCQYRDTALSECAELLRFHDSGLAVKIVEELTRFDPFNADAWIKLAELNRENGDIEEGLSAIEYAKALRPDDSMPLYVESTLLTAYDPGSQRAADLLQKVVKANPDMLDAKVALGDIYNNQGKSDLAEMIWREELRRNPDDELVRSRIAMVGNVSYDEAKLLFDDGMTEETLARRVGMLMSSNPDNAIGVVKLLALYDRVHGLYQLAGEYIKLLYKNDMLEELIAFMERERPENSPEMRLDPPSLPLYAAAQLRLGRYEEAAMTAREYIVKASQVCTNAELSMAFAGVKIVLDYIMGHAEARAYSRDRDPVSESLNI